MADNPREELWNLGLPAPSIRRLPDEVAAVLAWVLRVEQTGLEYYLRENPHECWQDLLSIIWVAITVATPCLPIIPTPRDLAEAIDAVMHVAETDEGKIMAGSVRYALDPSI